MPRRAREASSIDTYHVILRGINQQQIFYEEEDYQRYLHLLNRFREKCNYKIFAYCLMGNHVHLLIRTDGESLGQIFKRIGCSFVYWYNEKYERSGHLFQGRFKSVPVNTERSLLIVLRYILQNPVKAGICSLPHDYAYSSAKEYFYSQQGITDTETVFHIMDKLTLRKFILESADDQDLEKEMSHRIRIPDSSAKKLILQEFGTLTPATAKDNGTERQRLNNAVRKLKRKGLSIRQISRLTGLPKKIVEKS